MYAEWTSRESTVVDEEEEHCRRLETHVLSLSTEEMPTTCGCPVLHLTPSPWPCENAWLGTHEQARGKTGREICPDHDGRPVFLLQGRLVLDPVSVPGLIEWYILWHYIYVYVTDEISFWRVQLHCFSAIQLILSIKYELTCEWFYWCEIVCLSIVLMFLWCLWGM